MKKGRSRAGSERIGKQRDQRRGICRAFATRCWRQSRNGAREQSGPRQAAAGVGVGGSGKAPFQRERAAEGVQRLAGGRGGFLGQAGGEQGLRGLELAGREGAVCSDALLILGRKRCWGLWRGKQPAGRCGGHRQESAGGQGF